MADTTPKLMSVLDCARGLGIGKTTTWGLVASGHLETVKIGRRTLITSASYRKVARDGADPSADRAQNTP